jgi:periplasmic divalent cation tolerance protein
MLALRGRHESVEATQLQENDKPVLVYATFPSGEVAETMGRQLVEQRLAACVNILPGMTSIYRWEGVIERDSEVVMIVKTRASLAEAAMGAVKEGHPYTNPALLVIPVEAGAGPYIEWLLAQTVQAGT